MTGADKNITQPSISVCMPSYNAAPYIGECIASVLAQSFTDFELVIADDGSTDDTVAAIRRFADSRIRLVEREHGYVASLNAAVRLARGKYVARMDADDVMKPDRLLIQYNYMEHHPNVDLLGGGMEFFGARKGTYVPAVRATPITMSQMLQSNIIAHPTVMVRREALAKVAELYEEQYLYAEDYKLWLTMLDRKLTLDNLPDILVKYRCSPTQNSSRHAEAQQKLVKQLQEEYAHKANHSDTVPQ